MKQKIKTKIMQELFGPCKGYRNPPETFAARDLSFFSFIQQNEIGCYTCANCNQISITANDLQKHLHLNHLNLK